MANFLLLIHYPIWGKTLVPFIIRYTPYRNCIPHIAFINMGSAPYYLYQYGVWTPYCINTIWGTPHITFINMGCEPHIVFIQYGVSPILPLSIWGQLHITLSIWGTPHIVFGNMGVAYIRQKFKETLYYYFKYGASIML